MFSFNSPQGACESCDGLGHEQYFDPERVVSSPTLSLAAGAVRGWDRRNAYYFQMISAIAEFYGFDLEVPFEELTDEAKQVVLFGSGEDVIQFTFINDRGNKRETEGPFEGVIPNLKRRYRETQSAAVREELGKLLSERPCDTCKGERLNTAARHVEIGDVTLPKLANMAIGDAQQPQGAAPTHAVSDQRRTRLPNLFTHGEHALRRRSPANQTGKPNRRWIVRRHVRTR